MNSKTCRTKLKPQMLVEETFYKTKRFYHKTFRNIKSFVSGGYQKLLKNPFANPTFAGSNKIGPKLQEHDNFYKRFSQRWDSSEVVNKKEGQLTPKEQTKGDEQCSKSSMSVSDHSRLGDLKEEKKASKYSGGKQEEPSFLATENFAQKMEELEMMDVNDGNHILDIEEVVHYYSLLNSPAYLEIVDKFFTDVYLELDLPPSSRSANSSMRKLGSASVHSSMRKLDSASVHDSMRKLGSESVHGSMRKLGSASVHGSMRKLGSASVHSSMRKLGSGSVHGSMRKLGSASVHGSMRKLGSASVHSSMRRNGPLKL